MHDALGRTVAEFVTAAPREAGQQHETLTMPSNLSSGVYIITIHTDDIYKSVKIIKN
jgi:hypothetical protein